MALAEVIGKLDAIEFPEKQEHYLNITKLLLDNVDSAYDGVNNEHVKKLCSNILSDLKKENEIPQLAKVLQSLFQNKFLQKFFPEEEKSRIFKDVIETIDSGQHENVLVNCFSILMLIPSDFNVENTVLNELLQRVDDVLSKKNGSTLIYAVCNYFQKFLTDYEERLSNFTPLLSKLVFLPLCHPSNKVREVAEKTLDTFPKILLYSSDEIATLSIIKLLKETYCKDLLQLFREKQELYVLKVWTHVVKTLGNALSANLSTITPFFQVIEKGFKSPLDDVVIASFNAWKSLIDSFSGIDGVLNDSKRLRFILKPFKNISRSNENILSVACDTWMHLAWNLAGHLSSRFSEVCIPLLELTVGKFANGHPEKNYTKGGPVTLVKKSCYILLRFLELPPSELFNRLSSPKKLPNIPYPPLQAQLDIKIIIHHFKEILHVAKIIIEVCGTKEDMKPYLDCLMKSLLVIVSTVIEDSNKESAEAVNHFLNFLSDIIEAKIYSSLASLKCLESLSKLSRKVLVSHSFNCGSGKPQDILCTCLLKLLLSPHLFPSEAPKRFFAAYNRLVQAGVHESFHPLSNTSKFMQIIRSAIGTNSFDVEVLIEIWSGVATALLEVIEKTQEVNQGDKQEHDFSCMYDVLIFPFEFIFPLSVQQFRTRAAIKLWSSLYKAFIRCASLVATTSTNEASEDFCAKLKSYLKEDLLKKPHFYESFCFFMQSIMESIDFASGNASGTQGVVDVALMIKRKKPLGNLTSFVDLLVILLKSYQVHYIEAEDDSMQSGTPTVQRKAHIVRSAAPLDIVKTYFGSIKSGSIIALSLEQVVDPISKLFVKSSQKRNLTNHIDAKLEMMWNVISSSIERYYLGPYDSEFLAVLSPILEATFSHPKRNLKEKSRRFWFATFAPNASSLKYPDSLKNLLKKLKLPLLPDDISPTEFSISPMPDSVSEDSIIVDPSPKPAEKKSQPFVFISPLNINGEISKVVPKENKQAPKISIDDLPSEEFVKIDSPIVNTPRRRNSRKRKSFVPTLYNDLSQDTASMMSSSESQDTANSTSLDQTDFKESVVETKATSAKELISTPSTSYKNVFTESVIKTPMAAKFQEKLDQSMKNESDGNAKEIIPINTPENGDDVETKNTKTIEKDSSDQGQKEIVETNLVNDKISVFSKAGKTPLASRNTRRSSKLYQSFSVISSKKDTEKLEFQKLNKSCIEVINLSDSEDIIPSSQSSAETDNSIKLSVNNGHQKSQMSDSYNCSVIKQTSEVCLSPEKDFKEDFVIENISSKTVTSTPSKFKISVLLDTDETSETLTKDHKGELNDVPTVSDNVALNSDKTSVSAVLEIIDKEPQKTTSSDLNKCSELEIQSNCGEGIKDLSFLLDAVDNLVNCAPDQPDSESLKKSSLQSPPDVEMKDISVSNAKMPIPAASDELENIQCIADSPAVKRSRPSLKTSENNSSQNGNYSQKLRKKNTNVAARLQSKPKRKKAVKKDENVSENDKSKLKNKKGESKESPKHEDVEKICDSVKSKNKENGQVCLLSDTSKSLENIEFENNNVKENVEISGTLLDVKMDSKVSTQIIENAESCEIFETLSNSCEILENGSEDVASVDSGGTDDSSQLSTTENKSMDCDSPASEANEIQSPFASVNNLSKDCSKNTQKKGIDTDITVISIIPSSLEDDNSLHECDTLECKTMKGKVIAENSVICSVELPAEREKNSTNTKNVELNSDPLSFEFSIIEDDLSCEMHGIVNSIVGVNSENSVNDDLSENKLVASEESKAAQNLQHPILNSDKENANFDDKTKKTHGITISKQNDHSVEHSTINEDILNHASSVCSEDSVNSMTECNYSSCDVIMSSNINEELESSQKLENSDVMDIQNIEESSNLIVTEIKLTPDTTENLMSQNDSKTFTPELDHSYSISKETCNGIIPSKEHESETKNDKIKNVSIKCNERDIDSSGKMDVVTVDIGKKPLKISDCPNDLSYFNSNSDEEREIKCIIKDLVVRVERLNVGYLDVKNYDLGIDKNCENLLKADDLNHVANKENEVVGSSNDDTFAKGSKKRKIKPPIRSPFNFRHRSKMETSKKLSIKSVKAVNVSDIKSITENKDLIIKTLLPKDDFKDEEGADSSMAKIISSIVDSITIENDMTSEETPDAPSSSQMSKAQRIELSNDELTDLNTRLNAQIAHQTRRIKMIADSQTTPDSNSESVQTEAITMHSEEVPTNLSSILKKRKSSDAEPPKKMRKVTFASPLIHEVVFESCSESRGIEIVTMNRLQNLNKKRKKILQEKNKTGKATLIQSPVPVSVPNESEDIPSSSEYQDSDVLDFSDLPVSPALINCPDDISNILKDLTSQSWVQGLESLLSSRNIKTIGDVCKLNIHQVKALPFKSPKVVTLHKALMSYIGVTQEATLQKFKTIDDGSFVAMDDTTVSCSENSKTVKKSENSEEGNNSILLEETVREILRKDSLKKLPMNLLGQLVEACGKAITEKNQQS